MKGSESRDIHFIIISTLLMSLFRSRCVSGVDKLLLLIIKYFLSLSGNRSGRPIRDRDWRLGGKSRLRQGYRRR